MSTIATEFTRRVKIKYPIMCGGMQHLGRPELAASISNGGGLGTITALTFGSPQGLKEAIANTRQLTDKPFAVNLTVLPTISPPPYQEYARVIAESGVPVLETAGSNVAKLVKQCFPQFLCIQIIQQTASNSRVLHVIQTVHLSNTKNTNHNT